MTVELATVEEKAKELKTGGETAMQVEETSLEETEEVDEGTVVTILTGQAIRSDHTEYGILDSPRQCST